MKRAAMLWIATRYSAGLAVLLIAAVTSAAKAQTVPSAMPVARNDTVVRRFELRSQTGELRGQLRRLIRAQADSARAEGRTLFVEIGATWCSPCHELERNLKQPEMIDAFAGVTVVHLDANEWDPETDFPAIGIRGRLEMPLFAAMDTTGMAVARLSGVIEAAPLKAFFDKHRWPAQPAPVQPSVPNVLPFRLTVRPREMATGTVNVRAGVDTLDALPNYFVYVPKHCVGTRRVPLVVYVHGGGWNSARQLEAQRDLADKYGMILLLPNAASPKGQDVFVSLIDKKAKTAPSPSGASLRILEAGNSDARDIDAAMKQVLRKYSIDPEKIAVMGFSNGGSYALLLGRHNLDVFSRVGGLSALTQMYGEGPKNDGARFIVSGGVAENMVKRTLAVAKELRGEGHDVETVLALRGHIALREDDNYAWSWLARSWGWTTPASAKEEPLRVVPSESDPLLTLDALAKMTVFWSSFMQAPDSIRTVARKANQEHVVLTAGKTPVTVVKVNMAALAIRYPFVVNALQRAGLTAHQEEAYRAAIIRVGFTRLAEDVVEPPAQGTTFAKNLTFRATHDDAFKALSRTGMWVTQ